MLSINTQKVKSCGEDILELSQKLELKVNGLYKRICEITSEPYEWLGKAAELYVKQAKEIEYRDALIFTNTLKKFGEKLISSAENYEVEISKVK